MVIDSGLAFASLRRPGVIEVGKPRNTSNLDRNGAGHSRRLLFCTDELATNQTLGNLDRVEGCTLAQIVGYTP